MRSNCGSTKYKTGNEPGRTIGKWLSKLCDDMEQPMAINHDKCGPCQHVQIWTFKP